MSEDNNHKGAFGRQLQLLSYGEPDEVVHLGTAGTSALKDEEVLVAMEAAPIHLSDFLLVRGIYGVKPSFPAALGAEGVGIVTAVGSAADAGLIGKRVLILPMYIYGTWAAQVAVPQQYVVPVSNVTDPLQLAQLSINALTAYLLLKNYAPLMPGDWIGQTAANSAVGQYVIALAKLMGLKTMNVVRSAESAELVESLGGDAAALTGDNLEAQLKDALKGEQLSLVLDTVGGSTIGDLAKFSRSGSPVVGYSSENRQTPVIAPADLFYRRLSYHGFWVIDWLRKTPKAEIDLTIGRLDTLVGEGKLCATVGGTYALEQYKQAFASAQQRGRTGKFFFTFNN
jgi:NADPH:quinone reductase-like Zn-dependent oxidoreductase